MFSPGYSVGYLEQDPQLDPDKTVIEVVREGVQPIMDLIAEFDKVNESFGDPDVLEDPDKMDALLARQAELQDKLDAADAWNIDSKLERAMDALQCPPQLRVLFKIPHGVARREHYFSLIALVDTGNDLEQRGFTRAVKTDYTYFCPIKE